MTAEAPSAVAQRYAARARVAMAHPPGRTGAADTPNRGPGAPTRKDAEPVRDDPVVTDLVTAARNGDKQAWDALVERYSPLIWSLCRRYRLGDADTEDVGQSVWLYLVDQLNKVRDPAALPGWLATTTRRECLRILRAARVPLTAEYRLDAELLPDEQAGTAEHELLVAESHAALHEAFLALSSDGQRLIALLLQDPPVPYAEISARLGIPVGSIGPNRRRCLDKLRRHPAIAALINADSSAAGDCDLTGRVLAGGALDVRSRSLTERGLSRAASASSS